MDDRKEREIEQRIINLETLYQPASGERIDRMWAAVRETMDEFTAQLVQAELDRRGLNDTVVKLLNQHRQMEVIMQMNSVQLSEMQEQVNTAVMALEELKEEFRSLSEED